MRLTTTAASLTSRCVTMAVVREKMETERTFLVISSMKKMTWWSWQRIVTSVVALWSHMNVQRMSNTHSNTPKTALVEWMESVRVRIWRMGVVRTQARCLMMKWRKQRGTLTTLSNWMIRTISLIKSLTLRKTRSRAKSNFTPLMPQKLKIKQSIKVFKIQCRKNKILKANLRLRFYQMMHHRLK